MSASSSPNCSISDPASCWFAWKSRRKWPKSSGLCAYVADVNEAPGFWTEPIPALAIAAI